MSDFSKIYLYRMTHIDNVAHILKNGITHRSSRNANDSYKNIGDNSIIRRRDNFQLNNGKMIGDYIPFYFGGRMPMLYVMQKGFNSVDIVKPENIVYIVSSVQKIIDLHLNFIFTDGHAIDSFSTQYSKDDIYNIDKWLDYTAIKSQYWRDEQDLDLKRRKEAEFLVLGDIDISGILGFLVYNKYAYDKMINFGLPERQVKIKDTLYF